MSCQTSIALLLCTVILANLSTYCVSDPVFSLLKSPVGDVLCAINANQPPETYVARHQAMCEERCTNHVTGCLRYNWYLHSNGSTLCQLYASKPTKYDKVASCSHFTMDKNDLLPIVCNLARGKTAFQSSTYVHLSVPAIASRGVDGDKNGNFDDSKCTHTIKEVKPWWAVDLQTSVTVLSVNITNRANCCWERLHDVRVYTMDTEPSKSALTSTSGTTCDTQRGPVGAGGTLQLTCGTSGVTGRYVVVQIMSTSSEVLTLCEVEVFVAC